MSATSSGASAHGQRPALRDIGVALSGTAGDSAAVDAAIQLARWCGAHLHLLSAVLMPAPLANPWALVPDPGFCDVYDDLREAARIDAASWRKRLVAANVAGEVVLLESLAEPAQRMAAAARCADLVLMAMPYRSPMDTAVVHAHFSGLLFGTAAPVLAVPPALPVTLPPHRAVVAWSDTPEAARALHAALPLLRDAESVDVLRIDGPPDDDGAADRLLRHLTRHAVTARHIRVASGEGTVSEAIIDHARRHGAGLIVAGGYGHGRFREWALGGVTRELFLDATVPVLFAH